MPVRPTAENVFFALWFFPVGLAITIHLVTRVVEQVCNTPSLAIWASCGDIDAAMAAPPSPFSASMPSIRNDSATCPFALSAGVTMYVSPLDLFDGQSSLADLRVQARTLPLHFSVELDSALGRAVEAANSVMELLVTLSSDVSSALDE